MTTDELVDPDADVRYNAHVTGYNRLLRSRVREVQQQVALLTTKRVRDTTTAAHELDPASLDRGYARIEIVSGLLVRGYAETGDLRAEYLSLAATALICAEASDRPPSLPGPRRPEYAVRGAAGAR